MNPNQDNKQSRDILLKRILQASLLLICIAMVGMSFYHGITGDEPQLNNYGKAIWRYLSSFGSDEFVFSQDPSFDRSKNIIYYGGLFELLSTLVNKFSPFETYTTRHILIALIGFLSIVFASKIAAKISGYQAAICTAWLMFLAPFFLGHAMNNPKDIPFATAYIMTIYFTIRFFEKLPKPSKLDYLYLILSIGAAINIRVGGILLIAYLFAYAAIYFIIKSWIHKEKVALLGFVKPLAVVSVLGYFAGCLLWPYALENPLSNPFTALEEMRKFDTSLNQVFEGTKTMSAELPWYFVIKSFIISSPYVVLAGVVFGFLALWYYRKQTNNEILYFVAFTALFPLAYIIYSHSNVYHSWRHELFIYPSLSIVAGVGWNYIFKLLDSKKIKLAGIGIFTFLCLEPLYFIVSTFPNFVTYHNQLVGGIRGAYGNYELDFYFNSVKQSVDWFKKNEMPKIAPTDTVVLASNAHEILVEYFADAPKNIKLDYVRYIQRNDKAWDYGLFHITLMPLEEIQSGNWTKYNNIHSATVAGNALTSLIKRPSNDHIKAESLLKENKLDSALYYYRLYLDKDPNNATVLAKTANVLSQMNKQQEADSLITKAYQLEPNNPEILFSLGLMKLQGNDNAGASAAFTDLLKMNPNAIQAYYYLGIAQAGLGQLEPALNNLNTASQEPSLQRACYKLMGDIYSRMGNQAQANKLYQAAGIISQ